MDKTKEEIFKPKLFSDQHEQIEKEWDGIHNCIYVAMQEYSDQQSSSLKEELETFKDAYTERNDAYNKVFEENQRLREALEEWKEECERLAKVAEFWQKKYNDENQGWKRPKLDNL